MIALYSRVSTAEQAKEGYSIDEQIERMTKYCEAMRWREYKSYTDAGFSGGNMDRPSLKDLIRDVKDGKISRVLVYKLDRLSRSQKDTLELIEDVFLKNDVDFVSMSENFDTATPFGRAMIGILAVFAQLEREQIKERTSIGRQGRAKEGKFHGGICPIGYDYGDNGLVINEFEAMQIRELHKYYQQGLSLRALVLLFAEKGYAHKHGNWSQTTVKKALCNDLYLGIVTYAGEKYEGVHEPIIDRETFEKTALIMESRAHTNSKYHGRATFLGGLLYCKHCGARYGITRCHSSGKVYSYFQCYTRMKRSKQMMRGLDCKNKNYKEHELNDIILGEIRKLAMDPDYVMQIKHNSQSDEIIQKQELIKKEISKLDAQKSRFMDLYGMGAFSVEDVKAKVTPLNEQRDRLEAELRELTSERSLMTPEEVHDIVSDFDGIIERADLNEMTQLVQSLIERIEIDDEDIYIHWTFA